METLACYVINKTRINIWQGYGEYKSGKSPITEKNNIFGKKFLPCISELKTFIKNGTQKFENIFEAVYNSLDVHPKEQI